MSHSIDRVTSFRIVAPFTLVVSFDDGQEREINFEPLLVGPLFGPLADLNLFNQVRLNREVHTLEWPNGADFDPETLHNWPEYLDSLRQRAESWRHESVAVVS